jgi:acyl-CoA thioester hydrolase
MSLPSDRPTVRLSDASSIEHRVTYAETDQMGVVYHANYLIWFEMARTEHLRRTGVTYRQLEEQGVFLAVVDAHVSYRSAARYDDVVRIVCWVTDLGSRRVTFGYRAEHADTGHTIATGATSLLTLDHRRVPRRLPPPVLERLKNPGP